MWVRVLRYLSAFGAVRDLRGFGVAPDLHLLWVWYVGFRCSVLVYSALGGGRARWLRQSLHRLPFLPSCAVDLR